MANRLVWTKDELLLALDLYNRTDGARGISKDSKEVKELSEILRGMSIYLNGERADNYRNNGSVYTKLMNFRACDPNYDGKGLENAGESTKEVWNEFFDKKDEVKIIAEILRKQIKEDHSASADESFSNEEDEFPEGKIIYRLHKQRERNSEKVRKLKADAMAQNNLKCCICGFDFRKVYGELGAGFIECHHTKPISEYIVGEKTKIKDLVLVCANCHRMLHKSRPWKTVDELRQIINSCE